MTSAPAKSIRLKFRPPSTTQGLSARARQLVGKADPPHPTDPFIDPMANSFGDIVSDFQDSLDPAEIAAEFSRQSDPSRAIDLSPLELGLMVALSEISGTLMAFGANQEADKIFHFALPNLQAANAAKAYTAWLVRGISDETRKALQTILYRSFTEGLAPRTSGAMIAEALRGEPLSAELAAKFGIMVAGLNERLANAVFNYAQSLTSQGYSNATVMERAETYADRLLEYRGKLIARTETIRASYLGQQALWDAGVGEGYIDTATAVKVWSADASSSTCNDCLDVDGQEVGIDDTFDSPDGPIDGPPLHGNCRCSVILRYPDIQQPRESARDRLGDAVSSQLTVAAESMNELD